MELTAALTTGIANGITHTAAGIVATLAIVIGLLLYRAYTEALFQE